jgi:hypothetical protein
VAEDGDIVVDSVPIVRIVDDVEPDTILVKVFDIPVDVVDDLEVPEVPDKDVVDVVVVLVVLVVPVVVPTVVKSGSIGTLLVEVVLVLLDDVVLPNDEQ